jgi:hypothetical protein
MNGSSRIPALRGRSLPTATRRAGGVGGRNGFTALSIVIALGACAETGDFGRPKAGVWNDLILPSAGDVAASRRGELVSNFPFTDAEEELRDRSWRFLMPAHERAVFDRMMSDYARTRVLPASAHPSDPRSYYQALSGEPFVSPASRYRRIGEDAEADLRLIDPFGAVAARVIAADRARLRSLAYVRDLAEDQVANASARVLENRCLIAWVRAELRERTQSYRHALEHAFVAMPQEQAIEAERTVKALDLHRRSLDALPVAAWRQGVCVTDYGEPRPVAARVPNARPLIVKD